MIANFTRPGGININRLDVLRHFEEQNISQDFKQNYENYYTDVFRKAMYLTGSVQVAEDIVQETFIKLYNTPPAHANIKAWLITVATNLSYNYIRDENTRKNKEPALREDEVNKVISIEDAAIKNHEVRLTKKVLNSLPPRDRLCLLLKFSGYKYHEIAEIIEVEPGSMGTILARAQAKFKALYVREVQG